ncbi:MAG TPA: metalloregulator ArsR/SmtB family transcription factor [Phycisphaerales bacterium]|nr:metalloregulator ArsR/SmtB family transcription factor [Phycisphaerales bacterium]
MVAETSRALDRVFQALAHPARRAIVRRLAVGERNLSELAEPLRMTFPAASKHVRVLERAKLVRRRVSGRQHICRLEAGPLKEITLWTEQFRELWEARCQVLDELLEEAKAEEVRKRPKRGGKA